MLIGAVNVYLFKDYFNSAKALSMVGLLQSGSCICNGTIIQTVS